MGPGGIFSVIEQGYLSDPLANIMIAPDSKAPLLRLEFVDISDRDP